MNSRVRGSNHPYLAPPGRTRGIFVGRSSTNSKFEMTRSAINVALSSCSAIGGIREMSSVPICKRCTRSLTRRLVDCSDSYAVVHRTAEQRS